YRALVRPTVNFARLVGVVATTVVSVPVADGIVAEPSTGNAQAGISNAASVWGDCARSVGAASDIHEPKISAARAAASTNDMSSNGVGSSTRGEHRARTSHAPPAAEPRLNDGRRKRRMTWKGRSTALR